MNNLVEFENLAIERSGFSKKSMPISMQYLGGKSRISEGILDGIQQRFGGATRLIDLFSGSGVIAYKALARGYDVVANDIQPYSAAFLQSLLSDDAHILEPLIGMLRDVSDSEVFGASRKKYLKDYIVETSFFDESSTGSVNWQGYKNFCDKTILCDGTAKAIHELKKKEDWTLFLAFYRNTYFGVRQCAELDFLRELSEKVNPNLKKHLIASVISVMTYSVSSTTHLAQFLKPSNASTTKSLIKRRKISIVKETLVRLEALIKKNVPKSGTVLNLDFTVAIEQSNLNSSCVVYADPPYFKEHYSRYYHVLDTFVLYDYPELTYNDRLQSTTVGRYRENRIISDFGKRSMVRSAFESLIGTCNKYGNKLAISYACSSLVEKSFFYDIAKKKKLELDVLEFDLIHTGQGQARHKSVKEYLFLYSKPTFAQEVKLIKPDHDHPAGLIHPYWARKPLNIIERIIKSYSKEGDTVLDPFMGSGTSLIAAAKNARNVIGSDLSPLSHLMVSCIFNSMKSPEHYQKLINEVSQDWESFSVDLYRTKDNKCVERENFLVEGEYSDSRFKLNLLESKVKPIQDGRVKGAVEIRTNVSFKNGLKSYSIDTPLDLSSIIFTENTRIAVHKNVKASDFFTDRNKIFINFALQYIEDRKYSGPDKNFVKLFLSSMIPMLRLSDKKASSQWPYWRPKEYLTSRNPYLAIRRRKKAFSEMLNWEISHLTSADVTTSFYRSPAQEVVKNISGNVDLIVTDPPYADHAPYMEYSDLYWSIISGKRTNKLWNKEIVKTNAVGRERDSNQYAIRMCNSLTSILNKLKNGGYFVFFYLDKNIYHWGAIKKALTETDCLVEEVVPLVRQRRSMKAVVSPGQTLDGDLVIVCRKEVGSSANYKDATIEELLGMVNEDSYFERFASFIALYLTHNVVDADQWNLKDISRII